MKRRLRKRCPTNLLPWLIGLSYMVSRDSLPLLGGESVGKKAVELRAVTLDDKALVGDRQTSLIRGGVHIIAFFQWGERWLLRSRRDVRGRGKRLGDD